MKVLTTWLSSPGGSLSCAVYAGKKMEGVQWERRRRGVLAMFLWEGLCQ